MTQTRPPSERQQLSGLAASGSLLFYIFIVLVLLVAVGILVVVRFIA